MLNVNELVGFGTILSPPPATVTWLAGGENTGNATTYTWSAVNLGSASTKTLVIFAGGNNNGAGTTTITSLTIDGIAGTKLTEYSPNPDNNPNYGMFYVNGVTATSGDISVTFSAGKGRGYYSLYEVSCSVSTPAQYDSTVGASPLSLVFNNIEAGSVALGAQVTGNALTWTNLTQNYDSGVMVSASVAEAAAQSSRTYTVSGGGATSTLQVSIWR